MKNIFTFLMAFVLAISSFAFAAEAKSAGTSPTNSNMKILLIGDASAGSTAAIAAIARAQDFDIVIVRSDGDGIVAERAAAPLIANKHFIAAMATAEPDRVIRNPKINTPPSETFYQAHADYKKPPNIAGYNGRRMNNLIRADTAVN